MSKKNDTSTKFTPTEFQFYSPKEKQSFAQLLYNSKDGTYLGRTPASWGKLCEMDKDVFSEFSDDLIRSKA